MGCQGDIFSSFGFDWFEEPVSVKMTKADGDGVVRSGTVRATVIIGAGNSSGAGAQGHPETADRVSVVIRRDEWNAAFPFPPRFGATFTVASIGEVKVKSVQAGEREFTCRCTFNQRARER